MNPRLRRLETLAAWPAWGVAAGLVGLHLVVAGLAFDPVPHGGGDNTAYLSLARSLLEHGRYLELWEPGRPPHAQYPPGFPLLLAAVWTLGIRSWLGLKLVMLVISGVAVGLSYGWLRKAGTPLLAMGAGVLLAVAPGLAAESHWVLSDVPFWALTMAALLAVEARRIPVAAALALLALTFRTAGLPLLVALAVWAALRKRWGTAVGIGVAAATLMTLWGIRGPEGTVYVSLFWMENPYAPELGTVGALGLMERAAENTLRYGLEILPRIVTGTGGILGSVVGGVAVVLVAVGLWHRLLGHTPRTAGPAERETVSPPPTSQAPASWRTPGAPALFLVLYGTMVLLWPEAWATDRFLIPLVPVLMLFAGETVGLFRNLRARRLVGIGLVTLVVAVGAPTTWTLWRGAAGCRAEVRQRGDLACLPASHRAFLELARWSRGRLTADAVVISRKPRQWYWFSGYPGRVYPFTREPDDLLDTAREAGARYVVLDQLGATAPTYLLPALEAHVHRLCLLQTMEEAGRSAVLLGILPTAWESVAEGPGQESGSLRIPLCPASYRAGPA